MIKITLQISKKVKFWWIYWIYHDVDFYVFVIKIWNRESVSIFNFKSVYGKKIYPNDTHLKVKVKIPSGKRFSNKINKLNVFINILNCLDIYL